MKRGFIHASTAAAGAKATSLAGECQEAVIFAATTFLSQKPMCQDSATKILLHFLVNESGQGAVWNRVDKLKPMFLKCLVKNGIFGSTPSVNVCWDGGKNWDTQKTLLGHGSLSAECKN